MDAPRELAELRERAVELAPRGVERAPAELGIVRELAPRQAELERQRDEPLLGAVVQVALEAAALAHRDLDEPGAGGLQLFDPGPQLGLEALVLELEGGRGGRGADEARIVAQGGVVDDGADALAVALDLGDRAARAGHGQVGPAALVRDGGA